MQIGYRLTPQFVRRTAVISFVTFIAVVTPSYGELLWRPQRRQSLPKIPGVTSKL
jgi:hypothetical protein